ncbi:MAG: Dabb family protein [Ruminococcus sp.]|nr:Dabb family protein [Ruminococcus sp.]
MIRHIIIWQLKPELTGDERAKRAAEIKAGLEGLKGRIDGLIDINVRTDPLPSSNGDLLLDSTLESIEALKGYQVHPEHLKVAELVKSSVCSRSCFDLEI